MMAVRLADDEAHQRERRHVLEFGDLERVVERDIAHGARERIGHDVQHHDEDDRDARELDHRKRQ